MSLCPTYWQDAKTMIILSGFEDNLMIMVIILVGMHDTILNRFDLVSNISSIIIFAFLVHTLEKCVYLQIIFSELHISSFILCLCPFLAILGLYF